LVEGAKEPERTRKGNRWYYRTGQGQWKGNAKGDQKTDGPKPSRPSG
jgi:hypothetical protein